MTKAEREKRLEELGAAFLAKNFDDKLMAEYKGLLAADKKAEEEKEALIAKLIETIDTNGFMVEEIFSKKEIKAGAQAIGLIPYAEGEEPVAGKAAKSKNSKAAPENILIRRSAGKGQPATLVKGKAMKPVPKGFKDLYKAKPSKFAEAIEEFITEAGKQHFATAAGKKDFADFLEAVKAAS